jgi:hypothetical protein
MPSSDTPLIRIAPGPKQSWSPDNPVLPPIRMMSPGLGRSTTGNRSENGHRSEERHMSSEKSDRGVKRGYTDYSSGNEEGSGARSKTGSSRSRRREDDERKLETPRKGEDPWRDRVKERNGEGSSRALQGEYSTEKERQRGYTGSGKDRDRYERSYEDDHERNYRKERDPGRDERYSRREDHPPYYRDHDAVHSRWNDGGKEKWDSMYNRPRSSQEDLRKRGDHQDTKYDGKHRDYDEEFGHEAKRYGRNGANYDSRVDGDRRAPTSSQDRHWDGRDRSGHRANVHDPAAKSRHPDNLRERSKHGEASDSWRPGVPDSSRRSQKSPRSEKRRRLSIQSAEEGEVDETEPVLPVSEAPSFQAQPASPDETPPISPEKPGMNLEHYAPPRIKNRPTKPRTPPEPPQLDGGFDVPPPPDDAPPPPPDDSPPPSAPTTENAGPSTPRSPLPRVIEPHAQPITAITIVASPLRPKNRQLEVTKAHSRFEPGPIPVPHAPNPNLLHPPTRAATPTGDEIPISSSAVPRFYARPTMEEEEERYGRVMKGSSGLEYYDLGVKLGEGTFGYVSLSISDRQLT